MFEIAPCTRAFPRPRPVDGAFSRDAFQLMSRMMATMKPVMTPLRFSRCVFAMDASIGVWAGRAVLVPAYSRGGGLSRDVRFAGDDVAEGGSARSIPAVLPAA